jgi:hypothetical protein
MTRYCIHARADDPRHEHLVEAASPAEAAVIFVERWLSPRDGETEVELELRDLDAGGVTHLTLDLAA